MKMPLNSHVDTEVFQKTKLVSAVSPLLHPSATGNT